VNARIDTRPNFIVPTIPAVGTSTAPPSYVRRLIEARLSTASETLHTGTPNVVYSILDDHAQRALAATAGVHANLVLVDGTMLDDPKRAIPANAHVLSLFPTTRVRDVLEKWLDATTLSSSLDEIRRDPNVAVLKRFGWAAVPELLAKISAGRSRVQCAELLTEITGDDPVTDADLGNAKKIGEAWMRWGRSRGL
jgi:hypothetical protein